jgi:hypothetical protein
MVGTGKTIPDRDANEIGLPARAYLQRADTFVIIVDDLEKEREGIHREVFARYRDALDALLLNEMRDRASVQFFVFMVEAYFFAHAKAVNDVLSTNIADFDGDVERIPNPKRDLKRLSPRFDEKVDGKKIVARLDLRHVLSNPATCASLRSLFKWCVTAIGFPMTSEYRLETGICSPITSGQIRSP